MSTISPEARRELVAAAAERYRQSTAVERGDPGRVRCAHGVPPQARHPRPERRLGSAASAGRTPVRVRRGRDRGLVHERHRTACAGSA